MKILVISDLYPPHVQGGAEMNCGLVVDELIKRGHNVRVLTSQYGVLTPTIDGHIYRLFHYIDHTYIDEFNRRLKHLRGFVEGLMNYRIARKIAREFRPEFGFVWQFGWISILPLFALQDLYVPNMYAVRSHWVVQMTENYEGDANKIKKWYRSALNGFRRFRDLKIDGAIFISEAVRADSIKTGHKIGCNEVIHTGVPDEWIKSKITSFPQHPDMIRLVYVGRFEEAKGTDVAIRALEYLVKERGYTNIRLDLIGKGEDTYEANMKQYLLDNDLSKIISICPPLPRDQIIKEYSKYDVLLFTTPVFEALGNVILEAMSQGVLVIASSIGATREIIDHSRDGYLVPPSDPISMALEVEKCMNSPEKVMAVRMHALEKIDQHYRFTSMINAYESSLSSFLLRRDKHTRGNLEQ